MGGGRAQNMSTARRRRDRAPRPPPCGGGGVDGGGGSGCATARDAPAGTSMTGPMRFPDVPAISTGEARAAGGGGGVRDAGGCRGA